MLVIIGAPDLEAAGPGGDYHTAPARAKCGGHDWRGGVQYSPELIRARMPDARLRAAGSSGYGQCPAAAEGCHCGIPVRTAQLSTGNKPELRRPAPGRHQSAAVWQEIHSVHRLTRTYGKQPASPGSFPANGRAIRRP